MSIEQLQRDVKEIVSSLNVLLTERGYKQIGQPLTDEHSPEVVRPQWEAIPQEEKKAEWWKLEARENAEWHRIWAPTWHHAFTWRIVKTAAHPDNDRHARVKLEWDKVKDKGTHDLWRAPAGTSSFHLCKATPTLWCYGSDYEIRPIAKKKIDKSKLPIGVMTNFGRLMWNQPDSLCYDAKCWNSTDEIFGVSYRDLRIVPMTEWEVLREGDVIPEGLRVEHAIAYDYSGATITLFRITGIASGWSDGDDA